MGHVVLSASDEQAARMSTDHDLHAAAGHACQPMLVPAGHISGITILVSATMWAQLVCCCLSMPGPCGPSTLQA